MKIIIVGGNGTIGKTVTAALSAKHDVIVAGRSSGDVRVDIADPRSIETMYESIGEIDAVICTAGEAVWKELEHMSDEDFFVGLRSKLMGQVNLVKHGMNRISSGGSFTLTSGVLANDPVLRTTSASMVNGALHSFVYAAALEMKNNIRINVVCPDLVSDSADAYRDFFSGHVPVAMDTVVKAYMECLSGRMTGHVVSVKANRPG